MRWLFLFSLVLLAGCREQASQKPPAPEPKEVRTAQSQLIEFEDSLQVTGILAAREQALISAKAAGRISEILVDVGDRVKAGQKLAQIEGRDYELKLRQTEALIAQARVMLGLPPEGTNDAVEVEKTSTVRQAAAALAEATKNRQRIQKLAEEKVLSQSEFETATAAYEVALNKHKDAMLEVQNRRALLGQRRAELQIAMQELRDTSILAPFDGVIERRHTSPGEYLMTGSPIVTLVSIDPLRLRAEVPERQASRIKPGQKILVFVDGDRKEYVGEITRLSPTISTNARILIAEAVVPNPGPLRPGGFVRGKIIVGNSKVLAVPKEALVTFAGVDKVLTIKEGKAREQNVTTGRRQAEFIEITGGLGTNQVVVLSPGRLHSGTPVIVAKE